MHGGHNDSSSRKSLRAKLYEDTASTIQTQRQMTFECQSRGLLHIHAKITGNSHTATRVNLIENLTGEMPQSMQETTPSERKKRDNKRSIRDTPHENKRARGVYERDPQEHFDTPTKEPEGCRRKLHTEAETTCSESQQHFKKEHAKLTNEVNVDARNDKDNCVLQSDRSFAEDESDDVLMGVPSDQHHFPYKEPIDDGTNPHWSRTVRTVQKCMRDAGNLPGRPIKDTFSEHQIHRYGSFKWGEEIYGSFANHDLHLHYIRNCREQGFPYLARNEQQDAVKYFWPNETRTQETVLLTLISDSGNRSVGSSRIKLFIQLPWESVQCEFVTTPQHTLNEVKAKIATYMQVFPETLKLIGPPHTPRPKFHWSLLDAGWNDGTKIMCRELAMPPDFDRIAQCDECGDYRYLFYSYARQGPFGELEPVIELCADCNEPAAIRLDREHS